MPQLLSTALPISAVALPSLPLELSRSFDLEDLEQLAPSIQNIGILEPISIQLSALIDG